MSLLTKAANFAHATVVFGLVSLAGFQLYQIVRNVRSGVIDHPTMHSTYFDDVKEKVKEEYRKDNIIDQRDWYQAEDDSYLKEQVRANITTPEFKKQYEQRTANT